MYPNEGKEKEEIGKEGVGMKAARVGEEEEESSSHVPRRTLLRDLNRVLSIQ